MERQVFSYWEGDKPPLIEHCLETIQQRIGVPVVVLTPETIRDYIGDALHENWQYITDIAQKVDCLRVAVLQRHGGMWCDADTIILKPFEKLFEFNNDFVCIQWVFNKQILNGYFLSKKKGDFVSCCLENINNDLSQRRAEKWHDGNGVYFGESLFKRVLGTKHFDLNYIPQHVLLPISFPCAVKVWGEDYEIDRWLTKDTLAIALNYSHFMPFMRNTALKELSETKTLIGSILRYSLLGDKAPPATMTREESLKYIGGIEVSGLPGWSNRRHGRFVDMEAKKIAIQGLQTSSFERRQGKRRRG